MEACGQLKEDPGVLPLDTALEATSFEDAIRLAVSLGGDTDTQAAIAGGIAEARFGVPEDIQNQVLSHLDNDLKAIVSDFYKLL